MIRKIINSKEQTKKNGVMIIGTYKTKLNDNYYFEHNRDFSFLYVTKSSKQKKLVFHYQLLLHKNKWRLNFIYFRLVSRKSRTSFIKKTSRRL
jgi:hypothetical protein